MTDSELRELRAWAAKVCGYECNRLNVNSAARYYKDGREVFVTAWLPDQNIAQAFEVWEAIFALFRANSPLMSLSEDYDGTCVELFVSDKAIEPVCVAHENRCMAILLACREAIG